MRKKKPTGPQKGSAREKVDWKALDIVHPEAAGIDVGGSEHWVAVSPDRDPEPVRRFGCFTVDLREMARWLIDKGVQSVAIQPFLVLVGIVFPTEGDLAVSKIDNPMVGDSDTVRVAGQIMENMLGSSAWPFGVDNPVVTK